jgi:uncharacterized protein (TIGR04222 family)
MNAAALMILVELAWIGCWELVMLRSRRRPGCDASAAGGGIDLYDLAYLSGGPRRVVQVALLRLNAAGLIGKSPSGERLRIVDGAAGDDPVEDAVMDKLRASPRPVLSLIRTVVATPAVEDVGARLTARGLFVPAAPGRALALAGPAGLLVIAAASVPVMIAAGGSPPWLPAVVGVLALVGWARWPGARPTFKGRLLVGRRRRSRGDDDLERLALRGVGALGETDPRRAFFPALPRRRRAPGPRAWDPDLGGSDFIDRWLLRDLRVLLRAEHSHDHYLTDGVSAFWSDQGGGHHHGDAGHSTGDWGGGDHGGFGGGHHGGW